MITIVERGKTKDKYLFFRRGYKLFHRKKTQKKCPICRREEKSILLLPRAKNIGQTQIGTAIKDCTRRQLQEKQKKIPSPKRQHKLHTYSVIKSTKMFLCIRRCVCERKKKNQISKKKKETMLFTNRLENQQVSFSRVSYVILESNCETLID